MPSYPFRDDDDDVDEEELGAMIYRSSRTAKAMAEEGRGDAAGRRSPPTGAGARSVPSTERGSSRPGNAGGWDTRGDLVRRDAVVFVGRRKAPFSPSAAEVKRPRQREGADVEQTGHEHDHSEWEDERPKASTVASSPVVRTSPRSDARKDHRVARRKDGDSFSVCARNGSKEKIDADVNHEDEPRRAKSKFEMGLYLDDDHVSVENREREMESTEENHEKSPEAKKGTAAAAGTKQPPHNGHRSWDKAAHIKEEDATEPCQKHPLRSSDARQLPEESGILARSQKTDAEASKDAQSLAEMELTTFHHHALPRLSGKGTTATAATTSATVLEERRKLLQRQLEQVEKELLEVGGREPDEKNTETETSGAGHDSRYADAVIADDRTSDLPPVRNQLSACASAEKNAETARRGESYFTSSYLEAACRRKSLCSDGTNRSEKVHPLRVISDPFQVRPEHETALELADGSGFKLPREQQPRQMQQKRVDGKLSKAKRAKQAGKSVEACTTRMAAADKRRRSTRVRKSVSRYTSDPSLPKRRRPSSAGANLSPEHTDSDSAFKNGHPGEIFLEVEAATTPRTRKKARHANINSFSSTRRESSPSAGTNLSLKHTDSGNIAEKKHEKEETSFAEEVTVIKVTAATLPRPSHARRGSCHIESDKSPSLWRRSPRFSGARKARKKKDETKKERATAVATTANQTFRRTSGRKRTKTMRYEPHALLAPDARRNHAGSGKNDKRLPHSPQDRQGQVEKKQGSVPEDEVMHEHSRVQQCGRQQEGAMWKPSEGKRIVHAASSKAASPKAGMATMPPQVVGNQSSSPNNKRKTAKLSHDEGDSARALFDARELKEINLDVAEERPMHSRPKSPLRVVSESSEEEIKEMNEKLFRVGNLRLAMRASRFSKRTRSMVPHHAEGKTGGKQTAMSSASSVSQKYPFSACGALRDGSPCGTMRKHEEKQIEEIVLSTGVASERSLSGASDDSPVIDVAITGAVAECPPTHPKQHDCTCSHEPRTHSNERYKLYGGLDLGDIANEPLIHSNASTSGYTGVRLKKGRWEARINSDKIQKHLGTFSTAEEAVAIYSKAAYLLRQWRCNSERMYNGLNLSDISEQLLTPSRISGDDERQRVRAAQHEKASKGMPALTTRDARVKSLCSAGYVHVPASHQEEKALGVAGATTAVAAKRYPSHVGNGKRAKESHHNITDTEMMSLPACAARLNSLCSVDDGQGKDLPEKKSSLEAGGLTTMAEENVLLSHVCRGRMSKNVNDCKGGMGKVALPTHSVRLKSLRLAIAGQEVALAQEKESPEAGQVSTLPYHVSRSERDHKTNIKKATLRPLAAKDASKRFISAGQEKELTKGKGRRQERKFVDDEDATMIGLVESAMSSVGRKKKAKTGRPRKTGGEEEIFSLYDNSHSKAKGSKTATSSLRQLKSSAIRIYRVDDRERTSSPAPDAHHKYRRHRRTAESDIIKDWQTLSSIRVRPRRAAHKPSGNLLGSLALGRGSKGPRQRQQEAEEEDKKHEIKSTAVAAVAARQRLSFARDVLTPVAPRRSPRMAGEHASEQFSNSTEVLSSVVSGKKDKNNPSPTSHDKKVIKQKGRTGIVDHSKLTVGSRALILYKEHEFRATILKQSTRNQDRFLVHYDGHRKTNLNWIPVCMISGMLD